MDRVRRRDEDEAEVEGEALEYERLQDAEEQREAEEDPFLLDPKLAARAARLRYVSDKQPGITRRRAGKAVAYREPDGAAIRDKETLRRIKALAIPPAWTDVWICPFDNGHIQATGRDVRGRKQYRYHPRWREVRDEAKYNRMLLFGRVLPKIRARVAEDLKRPGLPREKVLAAVVRLLETTLVRIGNPEYAKHNESFGLTTLRDKHARVNGTAVELKFRAKHGIERRLKVNDRRLARIVRSCRDLPGQELFQYVDEAGEVRDVGSGDVNDYLREIAGTEVTAKDFRTWAATNLAALALQEFEAFDSKARAKKNITRAIETVAKELGNTPAICRKCYIHPTLFDAYLDGSLAKVLKKEVERQLKRDLDHLSPEEAAVLAFLRKRLDGASELSR